MTRSTTRWTLTGCLALSALGAAAVLDFGSATAELARRPGGDVTAALAALAAHEGRVEARVAMEARFLLWQATRDPAHLAEAKRLLAFIVEHAPPECRESMLANVRLHREIAAAASEEGLPLAADS